MFKIKRLRQVFVVTKDFESSFALYHETLGLELQFRDGDRWAQFSAGEVSFAIASLAEGMGAKSGTQVPVFHVDDLHQALGELNPSRHGQLRDVKSSQGPCTRGILCKPRRSCLR